MNDVRCRKAIKTEDQVIIAKRIDSRSDRYQFQHIGHAWEVWVRGEPDQAPEQIELEVSPPLLRPQLWPSGMVTVNFTVVSRDFGSSRVRGEHWSLSATLVQPPEQIRQQAEHFMEQWHANQADARAKGEVHRLRTSPAEQCFDASQIIFGATPTSKDSGDFSAG